jgi:integrase
MPIKLIEPRPGKTPYYSGRGTHLGRYVNRSTKAREKSLAIKIIKKWEREIESGEFAQPGEPTFAGAVIGYLNAGGDPRPTGKLLEYFQETPLRLIDGEAIDACAIALFPTQSPATRNREVYTPVSAILKRAGREFDFKIKRPKGSRGKIITDWLWPEQAFRIFKAAQTMDEEFAILLEFLCYTGCRLSDPFKMKCNDVRLSESFAYVGKTKNGKPRPIFLPPSLVARLASHPRGIDRGDERLFRFHKGGALYYLLMAACQIACGLPKPVRIKRGKQPTRPKYELDWVNFHTFCHTYATWMRRYGGLDVRGLVGTGRWDSMQSAERYAHVVASEEAMAAQYLPTPSGSEKLRKKGKRRVTP